MRKNEKIVGTECAEVEVVEDRNRATAVQDSVI